jgi:hypothetical protein
MRGGESYSRSFFFFGEIPIFFGVAFNYVMGVISIFFTRRRKKSAFAAVAPIPAIFSAG